MWLKLKVRNLQKFVIKAMGILQFGKIVLLMKGFYICLILTLILFLRKLLPK